MNSIGIFLSLKLTVAYLLRKLPAFCGIFIIIIKTMCPEVDSASENEYQGFLPG